MEEIPMTMRTLSHSQPTILGMIMRLWHLPYARAAVPCVAVILLAIVIVPFTSTGFALKLTLWLSFGLCALSLSFVWGRGGIFSFCQNAIFGLGGYSYAVIAINWFPSTHETMTALVGASVAGLLVALAVGYFLFYSRLNDVYLSIVTLALTLLTFTVMSSTAGPEYRIGDAYLGGFNGMPGVPGIAFPTFLGGEGELSIRGLLLFAIILATVVYYIIHLLAHGRFGLRIDGMRSNELRMELLGYDVRRMKLITFCIGGAVAGLGGGLFVAWGMFVNPSLFALSQAATVVVWVMVGGRSSLIGAFVGVMLVQWAADSADLVVEQQTPLIVGLMLIAVVLLIPKGIVPSLAQILPSFSRQQPARSEIVSNASASRSTRGTLDVTQIEKSFDGISVLKGISQKFGSDPINAIIGPNGAGKSTFFSILTGRYRPEKGKVLLNDEDVGHLPMHLRAQRGLGIKMQVPCVFLDLTVRENLSLAEMGTTAPSSAGALLEKVGLAEKREETAANLSHGEQQWLEIAMVLIQNPTVILFDEPGAGMSDEDKRETLKVIHELSANHTIIVVEHDMGFIQALKGPVMMLHQGTVFRSGSFDDLMKDSEVVDTYLGRRANV